MNIVDELTRQEKVVLFVFHSLDSLVNAGLLESDGDTVVTKKGIAIYEQ